MRAFFGALAILLPLVAGCDGTGLVGSAVNKPAGPSAGMNAGEETLEQQIADGVRANNAGDNAGAEAAFRAALSGLRGQTTADNALRALGTMSLAMQLSVSGKFPEANVQFDNADVIVRALPTRTLRDRARKAALDARLMDYRGVHLLNQYKSPEDNKSREAEIQLSHAQAAYTSLIPPDLLTRSPTPKTPHNRFDITAAARAGATRKSELQIIDPDDKALLLSLVEVLRMRAGARADIGDTAGGDALLRDAQNLATSNNIDRASIEARLHRTAGIIALRLASSARGRTDLRLSHFAFEDAFPNTKPAAEAALRDAKALMDAGNDILARRACEEALQTLRTEQYGVSANLIAPCLDLYSRGGLLSTGATDRAKMFVAAQVAQGTITSNEIAQASAALKASEVDSVLGGLLRDRDGLQRELNQIQHAMDQTRTSVTSDEVGSKIAELQKRADEKKAALLQIQNVVHEKAPYYGQLVMEVVPPTEVFAHLGSDEAFVSIFLSDDSGWTFVLRNGEISAAKIPGGTSVIAPLVALVRKGLERTDPNALPVFDIDNTRHLYQLVLGGISDKISGAKSLVFAPTGALLSLPFEVLLTGPADPDKLADAPWLLRQATISHVPSPANFVSLREVAHISDAPASWFGFGEASRITPAQAEKALRAQVQKELAAQPDRGSAFAMNCATSAGMLAGLPVLPGAEKELDKVRSILKADQNNQLVGPMFTPANVVKASLDHISILHFAAHAVLPSELSCLTEPVIVTSASPDPADPDGPLLTASRLQELKLDADLVILSACNSGGGGGGAGESLSGLARSFFYARARSVVVTHWGVDDQAAALIVALMVNTMKNEPGTNVAGALASAQIAVLDGASTGKMDAVLGQPYFWAPFAVIGGGVQSKARTAVSSSRRYLADR
jgi:CHAT domain-containing protein